MQLYGSAEQIKKFCVGAKAAGLKISGILSDLPKLIEMGDELFEICREYSISDVGVSAFHTELDTVNKFIADVNSFAEKVKTNGLTFSYHNHDTEFTRLSNGKTVMDMYLEGFDKASVCFMPDTFWVHSGGFDVRRFLELTCDRIKILHLKDMKYVKVGPRFAEVGSGNLYFEGIIKQALSQGIVNFTVEQDESNQDPILSLEQSYNYIKGLNLL